MTGHDLEGRNWNLFPNRWLYDSFKSQTAPRYRLLPEADRRELNLQVQIDELHKGLRHTRIALSISIYVAVLVALSLGAA